MIFFHIYIHFILKLFTDKIMQNNEFRSGDRTCHTKIESLDIIILYLLLYHIIITNKQSCCLTADINHKHGKIQKIIDNQ